MDVGLLIALVTVATSTLCVLALLPKTRIRRLHEEAHRAALTKRIEDDVSIPPSGRFQRAPERPRHTITRW